MKQFPRLIQRKHVTQRHDATMYLEVMGTIMRRHALESSAILTRVSIFVVCRDTPA